MKGSRRIGRMAGLFISAFMMLPVIHGNIGMIQAYEAEIQEVTDSSIEKYEDDTGENSLYDIFLSGEEEDIIIPDRMDVQEELLEADNPYIPEPSGQEIILEKIEILDHSPVSDAGAEDEIAEWLEENARSEIALGDELIVPEIPLDVWETLSSAESGNASDAAESVSGKRSRMLLLSEDIFGENYGAQLTGTAKEIYDGMAQNWREGEPKDFFLTAALPFTVKIPLITEKTEENKIRIIDYDRNSSEYADYLQKKDSLYDAYRYGALQGASDAFAYDYPEAFWYSEVFLALDQKQDYLKDNTGYYLKLTLNNIRISIEYKDENKETHYKEKYPNAHLETAAFHQAVVDAENEIRSQLPDDPDRYDIVRAINRYICNTVSYRENEYAHTAAGVFHKETKQVVCEGYAKAVKILCRRFGIPCALIVGDARTGTKWEPHMWDYIQMEDGNWYMLDATWNDSTSSSIDDYFLVGYGDQGHHGIISEERILKNQFSSQETKTFILPVLNQKSFAATVHKWSVTEHQDATCRESGYQTEVCKYCGEEKAEIYELLPHEAGEWLITTVPTCEKEGERQKYCIHCSVLMEVQKLPVEGHNAGEWKDIKASSCMEAGREEQSCSICGKQLDVRDKEPSGHAYGVWEKIKDATCVESGTEVQNCTICNAQLAVRVIESMGHSYGAWEVIHEADCAGIGEQKKVCRVCGDEVTSVIAREEQHSPGSWQVTKEASLSETGIREQRCAICGESLQTEQVPALEPSLKLNKRSITLKTGQVYDKLKITGLVNGDSVKSWKTSNKSVVSVSKKKGTITAGTVSGTAIVTIELKSGISKTVKVTVKPTVKKITGIPAKLIMKKGTSKKLRPVRNPVSSVDKITFVSSNSKVVTVSSSGKLKAKKKGTARITVRAGSKKVICKVTVK